VVPGAEAPQGREQPFQGVVVDVFSAWRTGRPPSSGPGRRADGSGRRSPPASRAW
jgi:hypothetical protein